MAAPQWGFSRLLHWPVIDRYLIWIIFMSMMITMGWLHDNNNGRLEPVWMIWINWENVNSSQSESDHSSHLQYLTFAADTSASWEMLDSAGLSRCAWCRSGEDPSPLRPWKDLGDHDDGDLGQCRQDVDDRYHVDGQYDDHRIASPRSCWFRGSPSQAHQPWWE